jgi:hypothetical protein
MSTTPIYEINTPADRLECSHCSNGNYCGVGECEIFHNTRIVRTVGGRCLMVRRDMPCSDPVTLTLDKAVLT